MIDKNNINDLFEYLKERKFDEKYDLTLSFDKNKNVILYNSKDNLLILSIYKDDDINCYRFYSDVAYSIVTFDLVDQYICYLFGLLLDKWN